jgi:hypothetical protein
VADHLKRNRRYWNLKVEEFNHILWSSGSGIGQETFVRYVRKSTIYERI